MTDLNAMSLPTGSEYEIFEPENAWAGAPARIVVQCNKMAGGGTYQIGYDSESGTHWIRSYGGAWSEWQELVAPPPPPPEADAEAAEDEDEDEGDEASDEYKTTDMKPKRGPGRPRKY